MPAPPPAAPPPAPPPASPPPAGGARPQVEIRRSRARRRTVSARWDGDRVIVLMPAGLSRAEEAHWVDRMVTRLTRSAARRPLGDAELLARAQELTARYLPAGWPAPVSVRWVDNQNSRWGSCTVDDRTIRLSRRLAEFPGWVSDYVLLHELAHLSVPGHGPEFWQVLEGYPRTERARGFLEGVAIGLRLDPADPDPADPNR